MVHNMITLIFYILNIFIALSLFEPIEGLAH